MRVKLKRYSREEVTNLIANNVNVNAINEGHQLDDFAFSIRIVGGFKP